MADDTGLHRRRQLDYEFTLKMSWSYAKALYLDAGATLDVSARQ